jgi:hypothetical protein
MRRELVAAECDKEKIEIAKDVESLLFRKNACAKNLGM